MKSSLYAAAAISFVVVLRLLLPVLPGLSPVEAQREEWGSAAESEEGLVIREVPRMATVGGLSDVEGAQNSAEVEELARFAVEEHNKKENAVLYFSRVVKAKQQVVSGILHHLTVEVIEEGKKKLYEAKVLVQAWLNFKKLHEFNPISDSPSITPADLGVKRDPLVPGWRDVPAHDPTVRDAANHAVKTIQERSNSLAPYELLEVLRAKAEVIEESARFNLLLKIRRGTKEEKFKVEVHKNLEGTYHLNQMEQDHSDSSN
ncbi:unnamed protein product [Spirodela intermedia]|uniref:Cysteine proteinase inhibitor n=1 Tax=Spirodela intermedia TaxID=51605 RepID=A0A7I8I8J6_SPIIN|nr:unnamed protein product [Spirodela intermedia]CAA6653975.1 unnamed protein product [Spirodela intermedia]